MRLACLLLCALVAPAGCGARAECVARVAVADLDEPVGVVGQPPQVLTLGPEGTLLLVDVLDEAPDDPGNPRSLPGVADSGAVRPCRGGGCSGPSYVTRAYRLDVASATLLAEIPGPRTVEEAARSMHRQLWPRSWGLVVEDPPNGFRAYELYGEVVESPCVPLHVGLSSPIAQEGR